MKKHRIIVDAATVIVAALMCVASLSVTASASQAQPGPRGSYASGQIRDTAAPGWCLTAPNGAVDRDPLFLAKCVKGDAYQLFYCVKVEGLGECSLMAQSEGLDIGQYGALDTARLINPDKSGNYNYILSYPSPSAGRYLLCNEGWKKWCIAMPVKLKANRVYQVAWKKGGLKGFNFILSFPEWKIIPPSAVTPGA